jgi:hypothetical protein
MRSSEENWTRQVPFHREPVRSVCRGGCDWHPEPRGGEVVAGETRLSASQRDIIKNALQLARKAGEKTQKTQFVSIQVQKVQQPMVPVRYPNTYVRGHTVTSSPTGPHCVASHLQRTTF